jgi:predicted Zn finger-like uncharacterized protein
LVEPNPRYEFTCPNCSDSFSIPLDRMPPVQARFRCPKCKEPMDFPSREEARAQLKLRAELKSTGAAAASGQLPKSDPAPPPKPAGSGARVTPAGGAPRVTPTDPAEALQFRVEKPGFQSDVFDRRGVRNLIRTGEVLETDRVRVNTSAPVPAGDLPYLKSLFSLAKTQTARPPVCCRTHTDKIAFFRCHDSGRPLCETCAPEKKFGGQTLRVCQHCGGTTTEIVVPA